VATLGKAFAKCCRAAGDTYPLWVTAGGLAVINWFVYITIISRGYGASAVDGMVEKGHYFLRRPGGGEYIEVAQRTYEMLLTYHWITVSFLYRSILLTAASRLAGRLCRDRAAPLSKETADERG